MATVLGAIWGSSQDFISPKIVIPYLLRWRHCRNFWTSYCKVYDSCKDRNLASSPWSLCDPNFCIKLNVFIILFHLLSIKWTILDSTGWYIYRQNTHSYGSSRYVLEGMQNGFWSICVRDNHAQDMLGLIWILGAVDLLKREHGYKVSRRKHYLYFQPIISDSVSL